MQGYLTYVNIWDYPIYAVNTFWGKRSECHFYVALLTFSPNVFIQYTKLLLYSHTKLKNLRNCEQRVVHNFSLLIF
jgi:hypothetical protein